MPNAKSSARRDTNAQSLEKKYDHHQQAMDPLSLSIAIFYYICGVRIVPDTIFRLDFTT
jgi:hypothetical protein